MKIVMLSKPLVSGAYQRKLEELVQCADISLTAFVPPSWKEPLIGTIPLERRFTTGYRLEPLPIVANGRHHFYFYRGLHRALARERPDILHIDEESFNFATFLAMRAGKAIGAKCCFYNWANIDRTYPPPFSFFEQYSFRHASYAIAGNQEAATIIRKHGYQGKMAVVPQFGVDPVLFAPKEQSNGRETPNHPEHFIVGYVGRLIAWKGVLDLVEAMVGLPEHVHLRFIGDGDLRPQLEQHIHQCGVAHRVTIQPAVGSTDVPTVLHGLDVLVLPSQTQPNWKEQFGRILIEAMSCGVPVIGSSSGEIPNVIGDAGLVVPERDTPALRQALETLLNNPELQETLARQGRERVLAHYTQAALARTYASIYQEMMGEG
jgi:glycosyltransferase involved in cell wall biosynthesis